MATPQPRASKSSEKGISYAEMMNNALFEPNDIYIAIMGVTGAGKTTFISKCVNKSAAAIGHSLKSETQSVTLNTFHFNNKKIHLIDTPGFDDTYRLDSDVLKDLAYWLSVSYKMKQIKLTGIVYLHRITDIRMTGSAFKNLRTFRKLIGKQSMSSVVLATTMWESVSLEQGDSREVELKETAEWWGDMIREGSTTFRHTSDYNSAMNIISFLISRHTTTVLGLQKEMVDERIPLGETAAGREVESDLIQQRELFERRLHDTREEMNLAIARKDQDLVDAISKEQDEFKKKIDKFDQERAEIRITMEKLIKDKEAEHQEKMADLDKKLQEQETRIKKREEEHQKYMNDMKLQREQDEKKEAAREAELDAAKERADQGDLNNYLVLRAAYEALQEQQAEAEAREQKIQAEAKRQEAELQAERDMVAQMKSQQALYQQAQRWQAQQNQAAADQQAMYQYQQQQQQQMYQAIAGGGAGLGMGAAMMTTAAMFGACTMM